MLVAGAIVLAAAQTVQAEPLALPEVQVPQVSVPQVSVPQVSVPQVVPQVSVPQISVPQVSIPQVSRPAVPHVPTNPLSNTPAPTRTQQRAVARSQPSGSGAAAVQRAGNSGSPRAGAPPDLRAIARRVQRPPSRRARRIARGPSSRRLRRLLKPLAACVATLGPQQERVLVRRAGLRGFKPQTRR